MSTLFTDALFVLQLVATLIFGGSQFVRMLRSTKGVTVSWFAFWEAFLILNLVLAINAHQEQPSRVTFQVMMSYVAWTIMVTADLAIILWKRRIVWDRYESYTLLFGGMGTFVVLTLANHYGFNLVNPMVKGWLAVFCKAVPQVILAYKVDREEGGESLHGAALLTGHITILARLGQIGFSLAEAGWDRNRLASLISEVANEASWLLVTYAARRRKAVS